MLTKERFSESQHFKQTWLWILLSGIDALFIYAASKQLFFGQSFGDKPMSNPQLIVVVSLLLLLTLFFMFLRLDTVIQDDGIYYRFLPFQWTFQKIPWNRILKASVRQYKPVKEYGGWGFRIGLFGKGRALNVSGNKGLQLIYDNGKKFLLGTQRPQEIEQILKRLGRLTTDEE